MYGICYKRLKLGNVQLVYFFHLPEIQIQRQIVVSMVKTMVFLKSRNLSSYELLKKYCAA